MSVIYKYIFFEKSFFEKMALGLCFSLIDLSTHGNIEQTPIITDPDLGSPKVTDLSIPKTTIFNPRALYAHPLHIFH
jgi:hypothetical protein